MRRILRILGAAMLICFAYLGLWPAPVELVVRQATLSEGYTGAYALNTRLAELTPETILGRTGPEDAAITADGALYVTAHEGNILRRDPQGVWSVFDETGG